jgi:sec-independent protein translocase protein TatC
MVSYGVRPVMGMFEHVEELRNRIAFTALTFLVIILAIFSNIENVVKALQAPAMGIKFLQFSPGGYFFTSIKLAVSCGLILIIPLILHQLFIYTLPALMFKERKILTFTTIVSVTLFMIGLLFSYTVLVPTALKFFITYGSNVIEPFWSFEQYFDFIVSLTIANEVAFQIPIIQIFLGVLGIISAKSMFSYWKYAIVTSTTLSAVVTPSTDPLTQVLMAFALFLLYLGGCGIVLLLESNSKLTQ